MITNIVLSMLMAGTITSESTPYEVQHLLEIKYNVVLRSSDIESILIDIYAEDLINSRKNAVHSRTRHKPLLKT